MSYQKTEWISNETLVSAEAMNKIEDQLETVTANTESNEALIKSTDEKIDAAASKQNEILNGVESVKTNTENILKQFPISGGTDFLNGIGRLTSYTTNHYSGTVVNISGKGILIGFTPSASVSVAVQIDGGTIYGYSTSSNSGSQVFFTPFKKSLKITTTASSIDSVKASYILL